MTFDKQHPPHGHPHSHGVKDPAVMIDRFKSMPVDNKELFVIKRLNVLYSKTEHPMPAVRTDIHCFIFLTQGETVVSVGDESYVFKANECAVIPAGQVFSIRYYNDCVGFMGGFHTDFLHANNEGRNLLRTFGFLRKWGSHKVLFDVQHGQYVTNIFERLCTESQAGNNKDILKAYLTTLLVEIDEAYKKNRASEDEINVDNELCNQFIEYIFEHPDQSQSIAFHADRLHVTPAHLQKIVKNLTGKTPLVWISEAVILEAKVLLWHTDLPVSEVAAKVGINDPSYFTRLFKKQVGVTPNLFRAEIKSTRKG